LKDSVTQSLEVLKVEKGKKRNGGGDEFEGGPGPTRKQRGPSRDHETWTNRRRRKLRRRSARAKGKEKD